MEDSVTSDLSRWWNTSAVRYYRRRILREYVSSFGSAPQNKKNNKIRKHAKNRNWQRATRLRLRQSLCQFQRMFPDFYFSKFYFEVAASANTSPQKHFRKNFVWYIFYPRQSEFWSECRRDTSVLARKGLLRLITFSPAEKHPPRLRSTTTVARPWQMPFLAGVLSANRSKPSPGQSVQSPNMNFYLVF